MHRLGIALLLLFLGCTETPVRESKPIRSVESPAAPYVDELWELARDRYTPRDRSRDDDRFELGPGEIVIESGVVNYEQSGQRTVLYRPCRPGLFDIDPEPPPLVRVSHDGRAVLVVAEEAADGPLAGCSREPQRLIYLPDLQIFQHVPAFVGRRTEAIEAAGSPEAFIAYPALDRLGRLRSGEIDRIYRQWVAATPQRRRRLEAVIFAGPLCGHGRHSVVGRLFPRDRLSPTFRDLLLEAVVQKFDGTCLDALGMVEGLTEKADADDRFAARLVESLDGMSGLRVALLRRRYEKSDAAEIPRPPSKPVLTADGYLTFGEEEILWLRGVLQRTAFPMQLDAFHEAVRFPLHLAAPGGVSPEVGFEQATRRLGQGYTLYLYVSGFEVLLAEVLGTRSDNPWKHLRPAPTFGTREEALAGLDLADSPRCDDIFEDLADTGLECYEPTPYDGILIQTSEGLVRRADFRRNDALAGSQLQIEGWEYSLILDRFPRRGLSLHRAVTYGSETWQLIRDPDLTRASGKLQFVDGQVQVLVRGQVFASLQPKALKVQRRDGFADCGEVSTVRHPVFHRELKRPRPSVCARLAADRLGVPGFEGYLEKALEGQEEVLRGLALIEWMRSQSSPAPEIALERFSPSARSWILERLCAELIQVDPDRRAESAAWIRRGADVAGEALPSHCF